MQLKISDRIKKYRSEKNLTQEEVASALGISYQAISKWERNDGYPDITMLPVLATYFGITVDELLGMDEITSKQKFDDLNAKWEENRKAGKHRENVKLMRKALKDYPDNALLLVQLSSSLERLDGTDAEKSAYLQESIDVQEHILRYCDDSEVRGAVLFNIADAYQRQGNMKKAKEYAQKLPNFYKTRENALVAILEDDNEKHSIASEAIERIVWSLARQLSVLAKTENDKEYYQKIIRIIDILYADKESDLILSLKEKASLSYQS